MNETPDGKAPVRVRWSNGSVTAARDWQELLDKVRHLQWWDWDEQTFRQILAKRAERWSRTVIDLDAEPEQLFQELARAGLVEILGQNDDEREEI